MTKLPDLRHFSGSTQFFRHPLSKKLIYTEGVKYLADEVGAHWLIDVVASYIPTLEKKLPHEYLFVWVLKLDGQGGCHVSAHVDSDEPAIVQQHIEYTDFPGDFTLFLGQSGPHWTLMLTSEY